MRKIKTGDTVVVISGKDKGKRGKVLRVIPKENMAIVEGVHILKKHVRPTQQMPQGGIIEIYGKIHISNLMLICPSCGKATRVGIRFKENGKRERYCKKCGSSVDKVGG